MAHLLLDTLLNSTAIARCVAHRRWQMRLTLLMAHVLVLVLEVRLVLVLLLVLVMFLV